MTISNVLSRSAAVLALASVIPTLSLAQNSSPKLDSTLSFSAAAPGDTWNTVLVISSVVLLAGLVGDDSTLVTLGGVGVLVSLYQTGQLGYQSYSFKPGLELATSGSWSLRANPLANLKQPDHFSNPKPSLVLQSSFKF